MRHWIKHTGAQFLSSEAFTKITVINTQYVGIFEWVALSVVTLQKAIFHSPHTVIYYTGMWFIDYRKEAELFLNEFGTRQRATQIM